MEEDQPFRILLQCYREECYQLYVVIRSLFCYPLIINHFHNYEDIEGKLYAAAFTNLCSKYLEETTQIKHYNDLDEFLQVMNMSIEDLKEIIKQEKLSLEDEASPEDAGWALIQHYRKKITSDMTTVFTNEILVSRFFYSIFYELPPSSSDSYYAFVNENFKFKSPTI